MKGVHTEVCGATRVTRKSWKDDAAEFLNKYIYLFIIYIYLFILFLFLFVFLLWEPQMKYYSLPLWSGGDLNLAGVSKKNLDN